MSIKRAFDAAVAGVSLAALSPVFAVVAAATALHFHQNPFYLTFRAGMDGKPFRMIKFRSLPGDDENVTTRYGKFLRHTSLDELPQLWNILKGDMSFVGPRPHPCEPEGKDSIPADYRGIWGVRPGLTGTWQVAVIGRQTQMEPAKRLAIEMRYARKKPSLLGDFIIMARTVPAIFKGHNGEGQPKSRERSAATTFQATP